MSRGIIDQALDYLAETCNGLLVQDDYISGIAANTWYYNGSRSVAKTGYTPLAVVGWQLNQACLHFYKLKLNGTTMEYGIALNQNSGTMSSIRFDFQVLYRKVGGVVKRLILRAFPGRGCVA